MVYQFIEAISSLSSLFPFLVIIYLGYKETAPRKEIRKIHKVLKRHNKKFKGNTIVLVNPEGTIISELYIENNILTLKVGKKIGEGNTFMYFKDSIFTLRKSELRLLKDK